MHFSDERSSSFGQIQKNILVKINQKQELKTFLNIQNVMYVFLVKWHLLISIHVYF